MAPRFRLLKVTSRLIHLFGMFDPKFFHFVDGFPLVNDKKLVPPRCKQLQVSLILNLYLDTFSAMFVI